MPTTTEIGGRRVDRSLTVFYTVVALIALAGQTGAAVEWLRWPLLFALGAVAAVEFGGVVLAVYGDHRRRLGERALAARILSAAVAGGAVAVNWFGHADRLQGSFFAGMSALGYLVWLLHSGARRRDQLRAAGTLAPVPPAYGLWQWLRQPALTRRARRLALKDPTIGLYGSLEAARAAARTERRQAAIAALLRRKLTAGRDPLTGEIAVTVYDLDTIAERLAATADYDGLAALLAVDLDPSRVARPDPAASDVDEHKTTSGRQESIPAVATGRGARRTTTARRADDRSPKPDPTTVRVARARAKDPGATQAEIAKQIGASVRTVARRWPTTTPNGGPVPAAAVTAAAELPVTTVTAASTN